VRVPPDFARALDADATARPAHERLSRGRKRKQVRAIEGAEKVGKQQRLGPVVQDDVLLRRELVENVPCE